MHARIHLSRYTDREDILTLTGMRGADDTFAPGLREVGSRYGVSIDPIDEAGFDLEYSVQPPLAQHRLRAFAELTTAIATNALPGTGQDFPVVDFSYQDDPNRRGELIYTSLSLLH